MQNNNACFLKPEFRVLPRIRGTRVLEPPLSTAKIWYLGSVSAVADVAHHGVFVVLWPRWSIICSHVVNASCSFCKWLFIGLLHIGFKLTDILLSHSPFEWAVLKIRQAQRSNNKVTTRLNAIMANASISTACVEAHLFIKICRPLKFRRSTVQA